MSGTLREPAAGTLYLCETIHGSTRACRFGFHRKRNPSNWHEPPTVGSTSVIWHEWRDDTNGRFLRNDEVVSFVEFEPDAQEIRAAGF